MNYSNISNLECTSFSKRFLFDGFILFRVGVLPYPIMLFGMDDVSEKSDAATQAAVSLTLGFSYPQCLVFDTHI